MEYQKLYRSRNNKAIAGVAGGLGEFFIIDPVIIRIIFVILLLMGGGGFLIYVLLWIFVPYKPDAGFSSVNPESNPSAQQATKEAESNYTGINSEKPYEDNRQHHSRTSVFGGIILITLGILFLADIMIPEINFHNLWPVILIVIGLLLLSTSFRRKSDRN